MSTEITKPAEANRAPTLEDIVMVAINQKVDVATLERLVALSERVEQRRAESSFNAAMAKFREECPRILKTRMASFQTKTSGKAEYAYAELGDITAAIDPVLSKNGLSYMWDGEATDRGLKITCTIHHVDGHKRSSAFTVPHGAGAAPLMNPAQALASGTTYGRRYSLQFALGICTDSDSDAHDVPVEQAAPKAEKSQVDEIDVLVREVGFPAKTIHDWWKKARVSGWREMTGEQVAKCIEYVKAWHAKESEKGAK